MPYISAWYHLVWATKNRQPLLKQEIRKSVFDHIKANGRNKNIFIDEVNGHQDHVHCLVSLTCDQTLSEIVQMIKGESSHWINSENLIKRHFAWQDDYFATSVSYSLLENVKNYIRNQEEHHKKISWQQEYEDFIRKYKFKE